MAESKRFSHSGACRADAVDEAGVEAGKSRKAIVSGRNEGRRAAGVILPKRGRARER